VAVAGPVPVNPGDPVNSIFPMQDTTDWITSPGTAISFGGSLISRNGGVKVASLRSFAGLASNVSAVRNAISRAGLNVVGSKGINLSRLPATGITQNFSFTGFSSLRKIS